MLESHGRGTVKLYVSNTPTAILLCPSSRAHPPGLPSVPPLLPHAATTQAHARTSPPTVPALQHSRDPRGQPIAINLIPRPIFESCLCLLSCTSTAIRILLLPQAATSQAHARTSLPPAPTTSSRPPPPPSRLSDSVRKSKERVCLLKGEPHQEGK